MAYETDYGGLGTYGTLQVRLAVMTWKKYLTDGGRAVLFLPGNIVLSTRRLGTACPALGRIYSMDAPCRPSGAPTSNPPTNYIKNEKLHASVFFTRQSSCPARAVVTSRCIIGGQVKGCAARPGTRRQLAQRAGCVPTDQQRRRKVCSAGEQVATVDHKKCGGNDTSYINPPLYSSVVREASRGREGGSNRGPSDLNHHIFTRQLCRTASGRE